MTYSEFVLALQTYLEIDPTNTDFQNVLPRLIEQAELRCYRDIDFLIVRTYTTISLPTPGLFAPYGPINWVVGRVLTLLSGAGFLTRSTLFRRDETYIGELCPVRNAYVVGQPPRFWAEISSGVDTSNTGPQILLGPATDQAYELELQYTSRAQSISATVTSTWLSMNCPDLLLYAALVVGAGYQKNFGASSDNPQMALSWEQKYQEARANANAEEARRKGEAIFDVVTTPPSTTQTHGP